MFNYGSGLRVPGFGVGRVVDVGAQGFADADAHARGAVVCARRDRSPARVRVLAAVTAAAPVPIPRTAVPERA